MNVGPIGSGYDSYSFYNSVSRVDKAAQAAKATQKEEPSYEKAQETASAAIYQRDDYSGPQETQVSTENSYQKRMLTEGGFGMDRIAGKLMGKLPQIFKDMMGIGAARDAASENSKVVISENNPNASYLERQAMNAQQQDKQLENISL